MYRRPMNILLGSPQNIKVRQKDILKEFVYLKKKLNAGVSYSSNKIAFTTKMF
jgi:hypothetical protein